MSRRLNLKELKHNLNNRYNFNAGTYFFFNDKIIGRFYNMEVEDLQYIAAELIGVLNNLTTLNNKYFLNDLEYIVIGKQNRDLRNKNNDHRDYEEFEINIGLEKQKDYMDLQKYINEDIYLFKISKSDRSWRDEYLTEVYILKDEENILVPLQKSNDDLVNITKGLIDLCCEIIVDKERNDLFNLEYFAKYEMNKRYNIKFPSKGNNEKGVKL